jgi:hypothetical protein
VKGIDADTRAIARACAGGAEITIGAWIDQAILKHAGQRQPTDTADASLVADQTDAPQPREHIPAPNTAKGNSDPQEFFDLMDQELEASRNRLNESLRPVGFVLKDLALRLVAAEALRRGERPKTELTTVALTRNRHPNVADALTSAVAEPQASQEGRSDKAPPAPVESFAPTINHADVAAPPRPRPAPTPPSGSLSVPILAIDAASDTPDDIAPLTQATVQSETPHVSSLHRPAPIPPTGPLAVLSFDELTPPPILADPEVEAPKSEPEIGTLHPPNDEEPAVFPSPAVLPDLEIDTEAQSAIRFTGVQQGFESNPGLASVEARADVGKKSFRVLRIAAGVFPFLVLASGVAGYFLAYDLGLAPVRDKARAMAANHADGAAKTLRDAYQATVDRVSEFSDDGRVAELPPEPGGAALLGSVDTEDGVDPTSKTVAPKLPKEVESSDTLVVRQRVSPSSQAASLDDPPIAMLGSAIADKNEKRAKSAELPVRSPRTIPPTPQAKPVVPAPAPRQTTLAALPIAPRIKETQIPSSSLDGVALISSLRTGARAGDPRSQHDLARRLIQGDGVKQDFAEGSEWFREAAIQGVSNAQYNLAVLYERGLGVTKDDVRALLWYHSAAEQSHPLAQYNLGIFYLQGRGIPLSYAEAAGWFKAASSQGVARATYNLAVLTEDGLGVTKDMKKALALYEKASSSGHHEAANRLVLLRDPSAVDTKPATFEETADTQAEGGSTGTTVANIQSFLRISGIYEGRLDGITGPKTRTAIREYQRRNGLPITGIPSEVLLDFMETSEGVKPSPSSASG